MKRIRQVIRRFHTKSGFMHRPPLISPELRLALFWSPKAGCTTAVKWFFSQAGLLDEALRYSPWIHLYRQNVFQKSAVFQDALQRIDKLDLRFVKVVRNPYARAVSSFIHANLHGIDQQDISRHLGRALDPEHGYSFIEFITYLSKVDIQACDPHFMAQTHALELKFPRIIPEIIKLEQATVDFRRVETLYSLKSVALDDISKSGHHTRRVRTGEFCGDRAFARQTEYKDYRDYYNPEIEQLVYDIYKEDFVRYGYRRGLDHP